MKSDAPRREEIRARLEDPDHTVADLLRNIEREPVPERLLMLAQRLQEALIERKNRFCGTMDPDG